MIHDSGNKRRNEGSCNEGYRFRVAPKQVSHPSIRIDVHCGFSWTTKFSAILRSMFRIMFNRGISEDIVSFCSSTGECAPEVRVHWIVMQPNFPSSRTTGMNRAGAELLSLGMDNAAFNRINEHK